MYRNGRERRRTLCNLFKSFPLVLQTSTLTACSSVLRVIIPDELNGSLQTCTLPVRPNTTTKEVCRSIAHKAHITNPQDYALFELIDGEGTLHRSFWFAHALNMCFFLLLFCRDADDGCGVSAGVATGCARPALSVRLQAHRGKDRVANTAACGLNPRVQSFTRTVFLSVRNNPVLYKITYTQFFGSIIYKCLRLNIYVTVYYIYLSTHVLSSF